MIKQYIFRNDKNHFTIILTYKTKYLSIYIFKAVIPAGLTSICQPLDIQSWS
ncbi:hypothetical protein RhiirA4_459587 [Rhizophagus irregularis]|uniref:Uncharacterized protein n=1 Tax=Rhizophagus irregularis TaxID=588596 RepID=A0A2I1GEP3_9GLOM|nr:hypothetical protein RhiirA4_459587 [Rhizophagus irregularis]